jgi:hypothetical protein
MSMRTALAGALLAGFAILAPTASAAAQCRCDIYGFSRSARGANAVEAIKAWQTRYNATWSCAKSKRVRCNKRGCKAIARRCIQLRSR